jgi:hypothetical protein
MAGGMACRRALIYGSRRSSPPWFGQMPAEPEEARAAVLFIGNDSAEAHHDMELIDEEGHRLARRRLPERVDGLAAHRRSRLVHGMHIQTSPAQIQPNVQHEDRASFRHSCRLSPQA